MDNTVAPGTVHKNHDSWLVEFPVHINGVQYNRGDELTGEEAQAVNNSHLLRSRCIPNPHYVKPQAAPATAPSSSAGSKKAPADKE